jgi:hypothetical protein
MKNVDSRGRRFGCLICRADVIWRRVEQFLLSFFSRFFSKQGDVLNLNKTYRVSGLALMIARRASGPETLEIFLDMPN